MRCQAMIRDYNQPRKKFYIKALPILSEAVPGQNFNKLIKEFKFQRQATSMFDAAIETVKLGFQEVESNGTQIIYNHKLPSQWTTVEGKDYEKKNYARISFFTLGSNQLTIPKNDILFYKGDYLELIKWIDRELQLHIDAVKDHEFIQNLERCLLINNQIYRCDTLMEKLPEIKDSLGECMIFSNVKSMPDDLPMNKFTTLDEDIIPPKVYYITGVQPELFASYMIGDYTVYWGEELDDQFFYNDELIGRSTLGVNKIFKIILN